MKKTRKSLSVIIAACMFISIFASMIPMSVLAQDYLVRDNTTYTITSSLMYPTNYIQTAVWGWGNMWNYTQKPDNSVNVAVTNSGSVGHCVGVSDNYYKLDGFHMRLNFDWNSIPEGYSNKTFYISLANLTQYAISSPAKPLAIKVDMAAGHIWLYGASPEVRMINQPSLLYSNTNSLDIRLDADLGGGYTINANGVVITATAAHMSTVATGLTNFNQAMVTFATEAGVTSNFDIASIHGGDNICYDDLALNPEQVLNITDALDRIVAIGTVGPESGSLIAAARASYDLVLTKYQAAVTNRNTLFSAEENYFKQDIDYNVYQPQVNDVTTAWGWTGKLEWSNAVSGKGITLDFIKQSGWMRHTINHLRPLKVDGLHVAFNNSNAGRYGFYRLSLSNNSMPDVSGALPPFSLRMYLEGSGKTNLYYTTSSGDYVLAENNSNSTAMASTMSGRWDIRMYANADGSYELFFAGKEYTIPKARMDEAIASGLDFNKAYFTITDVNGGADMSWKFDVLSVHGGDQVCLDKYYYDSNYKRYAITESMLIPNTTINSTWGWPVTYTQLPVGGTRITSTSALPQTYSQGINKAVKLDGMQLKIKFNWDVNTDYWDRIFWVVLAPSNQRNSGQDLGLSFYFNMSEGFMRAQYGNNIVGGGLESDPANRIYNSALNNSNFKSLDIKIKANGDGSYAMTLNGFVYTITAETMALATGINGNLNAVYASIAPAGGKLSYDIVSLKGGAEFDYDDLAINHPEQVAIATLGAQNGQTYYYANGEKMIYYARGTATLNSVPFAQGSKVSKTGDYSLVITDYTTVTTVNFGYVEYGDVSGDGIINITDLAKIKAHMLNTAPLTGSYKSAGSISIRDANTITVSDLLTVKKCILRLATITQ